VGWDTETIEGKCVLLCNSDNLKLIFPSIDDVLNLMTDKKYNKTCNLFYNLEYDTNAIIKLLPDKNIIDLANKSYTQYNNFEISIIPNKLLKIKKKDNEKAYNYFDLWQFFKYEKNSSLDNVSKKYLNAQKQDISNFDINNLKKEDILNTKFQNY